MSTIRQAISRRLLALGWDIQSRNRDAARLLRPVLAPNSTLLDVGCGEHGISDFIRAAKVIGIDVAGPQLGSDKFVFLRGSITSLPFTDQSFPTAVSIDTLEHLSPAEREQAIAELVRVAREGVVITFPCGPEARKADECFRRDLIGRGRVQPDWVEEHLAQAYPEVDAVVATIRAEAAKYHRKVYTRVSYSEPLAVTRLLRWAASRSDLLFVAVNLLTGVLYPVIPRPGPDNSYRALILAGFQ